jgi:hypothetical protein
VGRKGKVRVFTFLWQHKNNGQERKAYWITEVIADNLQHRRLTVVEIAPDEMISIDLNDTEAIR